MLTDFQTFCTTGQQLKFAIHNSYNITHLTLGKLLHYLGKLKSQILVDIQQAWMKIQTECILS